MRAEFVVGILDHVGQLGPQHLGALAEHQAELGQHAADAVDARGALFLEPFAYPVQAHHALLFAGLDRHEAHARPRRRLADRRGVGGVVLAALAFHAVRRDEVRRNQPRIQPQRAQPARPVVRAASTPPSPPRSPRGSCAHQAKN